MVSQRKPFRLVLVLLILCINFSFSSCSFKTTTQDSATSTDEITYRLSVGEGSDIPYSAHTRFAPGELNDSCSYELIFHLLSDISIEIDGSTVQLADAIRNGYVNIDQIILQAKLDAENGIASQSYKSELGLSSFIYRYDNFEIIVTDDVFEAADGNQYHCKNVAICPPGAEKYLYQSYLYYEDDGSAIDMAREDWGLSFEILNTTPSETTIKCTQAGGLHVGILNIVSLVLVDSENNMIKPNNLQQPILPENTEISNNDISEFHIDWTNIYGTLPSGNYQFLVMIHDTYDENSIHKYMKNYTDEQLYIVEFTVQ